MQYGDFGDGTTVKQASEFTFSNNEAMYACTSCGFMALLTLLWGFAQLQWDDEIDKESERNVWLILGAIVLLGALWSWLVVEPVSGVMQARTKNVGGRQVSDPLEYVLVLDNIQVGTCII
eukprot:SAG31_NODE_98_length_25640_cov_9.936744_24_plen_120_part_00